MAGPDEVVVKHRQGAVFLYLVLMAGTQDTQSSNLSWPCYESNPFSSLLSLVFFFFPPLPSPLTLSSGYLTYCAITLVTTFTKLDNPPISSSDLDVDWSLPDIFIGPSERYSPDFESKRFFARCVFQESHFKLSPGFGSTTQCTGGRCFCNVVIVDHPNQPGKKRVRIDLAGLAPARKGASIEIYLEFPEPNQTLCPTISDLLSDGKDFALPIVCDRTLVAELYSEKMFNASVQARKNVTPQGKMATTASSHEFPMNNKFWLKYSQMKRFARTPEYFSGAPNAKTDLEDVYETTGYSEHLSFDSTHINYLNANKLDFLLLTMVVSNPGSATCHTELNPMDWTILLGQLGGFWVVVTILFRVVYVPKAFMVPRWKKTEADLEDEMNHAHTEKLWEGAVRRASVTAPQQSYPLTPAQRVTSYPPKGVDRTSLVVVTPP